MKAAEASSEKPVLRQDVIHSTESSTPSLSSKQSSLNGQVHLVVLFAPMKEFAAATERIDGIKALGRGVYMVHAKSSEARDLVTGIRHISFKKTRAIPRVKEASLGASENRTYTVVSYSFDGPSAQQKTQAQRLIRRSPCVRLRPGVLLFPHLRKKEFERYYLRDAKHQLYNARAFVTKMVENGATVRRWSRLRLIGPSSEELVGKAIQRMVSTELSSIEFQLARLREVAAKPGVPPRKLKERFTVLARRFRVLRANFTVVQNIWHHDTQKDLRRTYSLVLKTRHEIAAVVEGSVPFHDTGNSSEVRLELSPTNATETDKS
ncbi:MAG: hypothetical protein C4K49_11775 [Candidatus Thorarchaeota archaeon]|nr:MAG: hypothetical protein C4K49_11775 [Candidatus Thorarchaeota archaeon]